MTTVKIPTSTNLSGDLWGGFAAMLVALPSAIAFGVTIFSPLGAEFGAKGALAGMLEIAQVLQECCRPSRGAYCACSAPAMQGGVWQ